MNGASNSLSLGLVTGSISRNAGGLFNSVRFSALNLAKIGLDVRVYGEAGEFSDVDSNAWDPIPLEVYSGWFGKFPASRSDASLDLSRHGHDVIHLHGIWQLQSRAVRTWRRSTGRPVMISPRGMLDRWALANSSWKKRIAGMLYENDNLANCDCLHALNASEAESMRNYGLKNPIAIIPNGCFVPEPCSRQERSGKKRLVFVGRIHPKKGLAALLKGWERARRNANFLVEDWELLIAGWDDGRHLEELKADARNLKVEDSVHFLGPVFGEDKTRLYREADCFILPSYSEGLPMAVLEAWSYGLPVMMTAECNLEIGFQRQAAVEISLDAEALGATLVKTLLSSEIAQIGANGRSLAKERFDWVHVAKQHKEVYEWLVSGGQRPACVHFS